MPLIKSVLYQRIIQRAGRVPGLRRLWRTSIWALGFLYFGFIIAILVLRYSILPQIENHRPAIEKLISEQIGQTARIGRIEASWDGINPDLTLFNVAILDAEGRPALVFSKVEAILSWWSVPKVRLELALLSIDQPSLNVRRDARGQFFVAGMPIATEGDGTDVSDWVLAQKRIRIRGAMLIWNDEQRGAPELVLKNLNFGLDNRGKRHRVGLTATPPENYASEIDFRGEFRGKNAEEMERGSGSAYAEIKHADLAIWRHWIDYPFALPRGQGGVRTWFSFDDGRLKEITADLSLKDVDLRLGERLAPIELLKMDGRLTLTLPENGFQGEAKNLHLLAKPALKTNAKVDKEASEKIQFNVSHFEFLYQPAKDGKKQLGRISLSPIEPLDIGRLARLASYLPLDETIHQTLANLSPQGQLSTLAAQWTGDVEQLDRYSLNAKFNALALKAQDAIPGFSGLSGSIVLDEQGGNLTLDSTSASIDLPAVFSESLVEFDALKTEAHWRVKKTSNKTALTVESFKAEFSGKEIDGVAQGSYQYNGEGPGIIDLKASLTRGDARAVWRFIPQVVSKEARLWLKDSLLSGNSPDTQLALKGDLKDFPFLDKSKGTFFVDVKAEDVVLDYANGWPKIEGIRGKLRFEGSGMTIKIDSGKLLGANVSNTTHAEVVDFDIDTPILQVKGDVEGATAEFLKFIDKSPVSGKIDRFTEDMRASGKGRLDLSLTIPLDEAKLDQSKIDGKYTFSDDEVSFDPDFPSVKKVNGHLRFTESNITIPQIDGQLLGGAIKISGGSQKNGNAVIVATGKISTADMGKQYSVPLLDKLSGSAEYRAEITVNKRDADLSVESNLIGLSSTLPAPFAKQAGETLALRFQKKALSSAPQSAKNKSASPAAREQLSFSVGDLMSGQLIRKKQEGGFMLERGAVVIGQAVTLPESGLLFAVSAKSVDLDWWNSLLTRPTSATVSTPGTKNTAKPSSETAMPFTQIKIKTPDLLLYGNHFIDVDLSAVKGANRWNAHLESTQASGDLQWESSERGKLTARFKRLNIDSSTETEAAISGDAVAELPAIDLIADEFKLGDKQFGRLEFLASNERNLWRIEKINATNPYARLSGKGFWQTGARRNRTQLDFKLESSDVGKLLERFAHPGTMQGGSARLEGQIDWNGPPTSLDFSSLGGDMDLEANRGQFVKIHPGAGKLLGLLSLQSLPRRITLDFKDVFSDGFAFEKISSKLKIKNGLMQTERLQLDGPAAKVLMRGEVDLKNETQNLLVTVQPELGGTAALGIALINPIAGAATWAASQLFQNPLNQLFGFDYSITGTWSDPKIEKLGKNERPGEPRLPTIDSKTSP